MRLLPASALFLALGLSAQGTPFKGADAGKAPMGQAMADHLAAKVGLSDQQRAQIKDIRSKHQAAMKDLRERARESRQALRKAFQDPNAPVDQLKALNQSAADAHFAIALEARAMRQEIRALMTPEQIQKADQMRQEMRERFMERMRERLQHRMEMLDGAMGAGK